jgi:hypothetical protein
MIGERFLNYFALGLLFFVAILADTILKRFGRLEAYDG